MHAHGSISLYEKFHIHSIGDMLNYIRPCSFTLCIVRQLSTSQIGDLVIPETKPPLSLDMYVLSQAFYKYKGLKL